MKLSWRRLAAHETDHELVWLIVSVVSLGAGALWFSFHLPWPVCIFHTITGHPCITCGATRSTIHFLHGDFFSSWTWNPLVFVSLCGVAVFDLYAFIALVTGSPRLRMAALTRREKIVGRVFVVGLLALNWIWVLQHSSALRL